METASQSPGPESFPHGMIKFLPASLIFIFALSLFVIHSFILLHPTVYSISLIPIWTLASPTILCPSQDLLSIRHSNVQVR